MSLSCVVCACGGKEFIELRKTTVVSAAISSVSVYNQNHAIAQPQPMHERAASMLNGVCKDGSEVVIFPQLLYEEHFGRQLGSERQVATACIMKESTCGRKCCAIARR